MYNRKFDFTGRRALVLWGAVLVVSCLGPSLMAHAQQAHPTVTSRSVSADTAGTILGRDVVDSQGETVGLLVDMLVDKDGHPLAGVVDAGGFIGLGTRRVAISWSLLHFVHANGDIIIKMDLTFDSAAGAPEFQGPDNNLIVIDRPPP